MVIKGKVAHALSNKLARLGLIRQLLAQLHQEESALVDEIEALLSTVTDPASVRGVRVVEVMLDGAEQSDANPDRGGTGTQTEG
jgi:hypothetical protein